MSRRRENSAQRRPGHTRSDLLVINKIDLAPYVGASLEVMARDAQTMRKARPFVMTNMKTGEGLDAILAFLSERAGVARGSTRTTFEVSRQERRRLASDCLRSASKKPVRALRARATV